MDELCSFVHRKSQKVWVWLALCRETRQVVAFVEGDRSRATCQRLWRAIPEFYKRATCYSDCGRLTKRRSLKSGTRPLARRKVKRTTWSDGSTP